MKNEVEVHGHELLTTKRKKYNDREALALVESKSSAENRGRDVVHQSLERLWFECVAGYIGNGGSSVAGVFQSLDHAVLLDPGEELYKANHIAPFVLRQVARLCASKGRFETLPRSSDWQDQRASKVADHLLNYWHDTCRLQAARRDLAFWQVVCGTGFIYTDWDQKAGPSKRRYIDPMDESRVYAADQVPPETRRLSEVLGTYRDDPDGSIELEAISPFQVLIPAAYTEVDKTPWLIIERNRSMEWLWRHYPEVAKKVRPEDFLDTKVSYWWRKLAGIVRDRGAILPGTQGLMDESILVREFWRPPSPMVEQGARILVCQKHLLANDPHPSYQDNTERRYPIRMARFAAVPGRLWGMGMVENLIDPQREFNRSRSQIIQHRDVLSHPQWLVPRGAELTSRRVNIGDLWEYTQGKPPTLQNPPALSQAHQLTTDAALNDMRLIASQSEVTQGQTLPGVRSGTAIRALQERDMETVGPAYEEHEQCIQDVSHDILELSVAYLEVPRAVRIYGKHKAVDVQYFKGSDLRGNTAVVVQPGSMAPKSKAMAQENVMNLLQLGGLNPQDPVEKRLIAHTLELGDLDQEYTLYDLNIRRAEIENDIFLTPQRDPVTGRPRMPPDVMDFDDHVIHVERHTALCLTDAFEAADPAIKQAILAHVMKHQKALAQMVMLQQQMAAQQPQKGSEPKETGKASQPKREAQVA